MGLSIDEYPVYQNAANIAAYVNIRNITQDKSTDTFTLTGFANISVASNQLFVNALFIRLESEAPFDDVWSSLYTELKRQLTDRDITFTDS